MALATNFAPTQNIKCIIGTEAVIGDGAVHGSGAFYRLPLLEPPTITSNQVPLEMGSQQTGIFTPNIAQMHQREDGVLYEITLKYLGYASTGDGQGFEELFNEDGSAYELKGNYSPPDWTNGATNTYSEHATSVIYLGGTANGDSATDHKYVGCVCKSIELSHSLDSNGGFPVITATYVTGYKANYSNDISAGNGTNITWSDILSNSGIHWATTTARVGDITSANYDVRAYGYSISISREIARVGYINTTTFEPYSYEMVGAFDIKGSITYKLDSNHDDINNYYRGDTKGAFQITGSAYLVSFYGLVSDADHGTGSSEIRTTVSWQGAEDPTTANVILSIDL